MGLIRPFEVNFVSFGANRSQHGPIQSKNVNEDPGQLGPKGANIGENTNWVKFSTIRIDESQLRLIRANPVDLRLIFVY